MSGCKDCAGGCGGCSKALELNEGELAMLQKLGQIPFLPVVRTASDPTPIHITDGDMTVEECSLVLQCLEKKGLISIDFDAPIKGFAEHDYDAFPIRGSFALTLRGQQVLELLEIQGLSNEESNGTI